MIKEKSSLIFLLSFSSSFFAVAQSPDVKSFLSFDLEVETNIRAIHVLNDSTVWFAGSNGIFGFTENNGASWTIDTLSNDSLIPEFRGIALTNDYTIFLMNVGSPAFIWKSDDIGVTWTVVYENYHDDIFLDAIVFSDERNGMVVGDPIRNCFQVLLSTDSGNTWQPVSCASIPESRGGEAGFASSNSGLKIMGRSIWFGSGALHARIFTSIDGGRRWKAYEATIAEGTELTGIFSLDFYDRYTGIIAGGDYNDKSSTALTVALTSDEGKTWQPVDEEDSPPFVSCIRYQPGSGGKVIVAACLPGIYFSEDGGSHWNKMKNEYGKVLTESFYALQFSPGGRVAWFAGGNGKLARLGFK